jgi:hypothetical protein
MEDDQRPDHQPHFCALCTGAPSTYPRRVITRAWVWGIRGGLRHHVGPECSYIAQGHLGNDLRLQYATQKFVWGLTMEKRDTDVLSQKYRVLLIRHDFLLELTSLDDQKIVGTGHPGYLSYKRDRLEKLRTMRALYTSGRAREGLFLVGEVSIAVQCPGGSSQIVDIPWERYYRREPELKDEGEAEGEGAVAAAVTRRGRNNGGGADGGKAIEDDDSDGASAVSRRRPSPMLSSRRRGRTSSGPAAAVAGAGRSDDGGHHHHKSLPTGRQGANMTHQQRRRRGGGVGGVGGFVSSTSSAPSSLWLSETVPASGSRSPSSSHSGDHDGSGGSVEQRRLSPRERYERLTSSELLRHSRRTHSGGDRSSTYR